VGGFTPWARMRSRARELNTALDAFERPLGAIGRSRFGRPGRFPTRKRFEKSISKKKFIDSCPYAGVNFWIKKGFIESILRTSFSLLLP
jgi:hypothetical protein